jgi:hypothetical protein
VTPLSKFVILYYGHSKVVTDEGLISKLSQLKRLIYIKIPDIKSDLDTNQNTTKPRYQTALSAISKITLISLLAIVIERVKFVSLSIS